MKPCGELCVKMLMRLWVRQSFGWRLLVREVVKSLRCVLLSARAEMYRHSTRYPWFKDYSSQSGIEILFK